ncbi:hypothetical protein BD769DRAFT_1630071 [Suillus cothurnatus]|nr:hypothetical protein BD769DRAFT_1630071 [Suillus cothurnatus]
MNKTHFKYKRTTLCLLDITRFTVQTVMSSLETDTTIWQSCRHKDISKKIQVFLYKTLIAVYQIGDFWTLIPSYEHRALCKSCPSKIKSMEHILTHCSDPTGKIIWDLACIILGCNAATKKGTSHLLQILLSESAYLVWTLRCKRVIWEMTHSEKQIIKRWINVIDHHFQLDRALASKTRRDTKTMIKVRSMWSDVINDTQQN